MASHYGATAVEKQRIGILLLLGSSIADYRPNSKTCRDPYGYIDGGLAPGTSYQVPKLSTQVCCNSATWKAQALLLQIIPELNQIW